MRYAAVRVLLSLAIGIALGRIVLVPWWGILATVVLAVVLFRWRRGTIPFDVQAGATVALLVFLDVPPIDPLRRLAEWLVGA